MDENGGDPVLSSIHANRHIAETARLKYWIVTDLGHSVKTAPIIEDTN